MTLDYRTTLLTYEGIGSHDAGAMRGDDTMSGRGSGKGLVRASWRQLRKDRELIWLPVLGGFVAALAAAPVAVVAFFTTSDGEPWGYVLAGVGLLVATFITTLFAVAFAAGADERLDGGDPTLRSCLSAAWSRKWAVLQWALLSVVVGLVLRALREKAGPLGKVLAGLGGLAWGVGTYFVIPILAGTRTSAWSAVGTSAQLMRKKWGNALRVQIRLGLYVVVWLLAAVGAGFGVYALSQTSTVVAAAVAVVAVVVLVYAALVLSVLGAYVRVALWRFATGRPVPGFDPSRLEAAVRVKSTSA